MTASSPSFFGLARRSFWLFFGAIWLLAGVAMLVFGVVFALREQEFASNGAVATGIVLEKRFIPADSDSSTEYRVSYRFTSVDGQVVEGSDAVSVETWEALTERGPVVVRYLQGQPATNRLTLGSDLFGAVIFLVAGVILTGIGGALVFRAVRGIRKTRRLLRVGVPSDATVTSVEPTNVFVNRRPQFRVRYSFVDGQGSTHTGDSGYLEYEEAHRWTPGDVASIRYDPANPDDSHWLGSDAPPEAATEKPRIIDAPPPRDAAPPVDAPPPA